MFRYIVCSLILLGFLWLVKAGLHTVLDTYGFWPFMALCGVLVPSIIAAAFGWDYYEAHQRRPSQEVLPPLPQASLPSRRKPRFPSAN